MPITVKYLRNYDVMKKFSAVESMFPGRLVVGEAINSMIRGSIYSGRFLPLSGSIGCGALKSSISNLSHTVNRTSNDDDTIQFCSLRKLPNHITLLLTELEMLGELIC